MYVCLPVCLCVYASVSARGFTLVPDNKPAFVADLYRFGTRSTLPSNLWHIGAVPLQVRRVLSYKCVGVCSC
jgi:hypothetical protein